MKQVSEYQNSGSIQVEKGTEEIDDIISKT